jgi:regulator of sigma E protease
MLYQILMVALMVFGFGFVVFFHELGHFLAAKWVGIKVEQFAVGFGQALFAWRQGIGWKAGTTQKEYMRRIEEHLASKSVGEPKSEYTDEQISRAADELGLGETEYRLNWIPLGGYVKMLGQDDLKPNATANDPRAYNRKGVGQRMIVVSAGVIMNIILAAIGFMVVFLIGLKAPSPIVGSVLSGSPAQKAGLQVGDQVWSMDGVRQHDFTKIALNTALLKEGEGVPLEYYRPGVQGLQKTTIKPERSEPDKKAFLSIGIRQSQSLYGLDPKEVSDEDFKKLTDTTQFLPDESKIKPGERIVAVQGQAVVSDATHNDYYVLDRALQASDGKPVTVTVEGRDGKQREEQINPALERPFELIKNPNFAGMEPRPRVEGVPAETSSVKGKLLPGDVIIRLKGEKVDLEEFPGVDMLKRVADKAYQAGNKLTVTVLRNGEVVDVTGIEPRTKTDKDPETGKDRHGLGIQLGYDLTAVVSLVEADSPAKKAGIPDGAKIVAVDGEPVENWMHFRRLMAKSEGAHQVQALLPDPKSPATYVQEPRTFTLTLGTNDASALKDIRVTQELMLREYTTVRRTSSPLTAAAWGTSETRDFVLQFYLTLKRMFQGSVSYTNMMGPVGIVTAGARFAFKGIDWLIWFLAMISANLAVVNFLPIPIVDGGLFTFLILEKIQGKPLSPRAQAVAQIVGFAVIISVFLLVTFQDIKRTMGM